MGKFKELLLEEKNKMVNFSGNLQEYFFLVKKCSQQWTQNKNETISVKKNKIFFKEDKRLSRTIVLEFLNFQNKDFIRIEIRDKVRNPLYDFESLFIGFSDCLEFLAEFFNIEFIIFVEKSEDSRIETKDISEKLTHLNTKFSLEESIPNERELISILRKKLGINQILKDKEVVEFLVIDKLFSNQLDSVYLSIKEFWDVIKKSKFVLFYDEDKCVTESSFLEAVVSNKPISLEFYLGSELQSKDSYLIEAGVYFDNTLSVTLNDKEFEDANAFSEYLSNIEKRIIEESMLEIIVNNGLTSTVKNSLNQASKGILERVVFSDTFIEKMSEDILSYYNDIQYLMDILHDFNSKLTKLIELNKVALFALNIPFENGQHLLALMQTKLLKSDSLGQTLGRGKYYFDENPKFLIIKSEEEYEQNILKEIDEFYKNNIKGLFNKE